MTPTFEAQIQAAAQECEQRDWQFFDYEGWEGDPKHTFIAGARKALELLARAEEGHGPRVWVSKKSFRLVSGGEAPDAGFVEFQDSQEYCPITELIEAKAEKDRTDAAQSSEIIRLSKLVDEERSKRVELEDMEEPPVMPGKLVGTFRGIFQPASAEHGPRENLKAWVHWVKLNPLDDDQLQHAIATESLLTELLEARAKAAKLSADIRQIAKHTDCECDHCDPIVIETEKK